LDTAVQVNLLGPARLASTLAATGWQGHLIAVSTAYVAGARRGPAPERLLSYTPFSTRVDWRAEVEASSSARAQADADSRRPEMLARFQREAREELGAAGVPLLAQRAERRRSEWVERRLVEAGRARARSLGWPDAYAYTKALGEQALVEAAQGMPVSIVRPSIIESALAEPHPGWIRGFRMAEPVIISYARGLLVQFPGVPEGVIDVIPVDLVVGAILAIAARGRPEAPTVYQVASGSTNPLRYGTLVELTRRWFTEHPLQDRHGQPIVLPEWSFPGRGRVRRQLSWATRGLSAGERVISALPLRGAPAELAARLEERRSQAERALSYVELYGSYTESEASFEVERLMALWDSLDAEDQRRFCFDPRVIDWPRYLHEVHLPSVVVHGRVRTAASPRRGPSRQERGRAAVLSRQRQLAAFDLENTLVASNVVESYTWLATRRLPGRDRARLAAKLLAQAPALAALDRRDRGDFLRYFYRRYADAPAGQLRQDSWEMFSHLILAKAFPEGLRRVREHRRAGHRTILVTGALDFVVDPLRPLFDDVVCPSLGESAGRLDGRMTSSPPAGEARALVLSRYAEAEGMSMDECVAYADSTSDLPMLEAVGHPVAVNPEAKLAAIARRRGWHIETWSKAPGLARVRLPMGPRA
ncbi:MAG TPA: HAD-IB family phosphatase, partial [Acidimicrobiales bacterium]|nr:HAD-IB family phosphatase [Acidimicrobiales bacterium]